MQSRRLQAIAWQYYDKPINGAKKTKKINKVNMHCSLPTDIRFEQTQTCNLKFTSLDLILATYTESKIPSDQG